MENIPPGKKTVQIIGVKAIHSAKTPRRWPKRLNADAAAPETADEVPANAQGNNQTIETTLGVTAAELRPESPQRPRQAMISDEHVCHLCSIPVWRA